MRLPRRQLPIFTPHWSGHRFSVTAILLITLVACFIVQILVERMSPTGAALIADLGLSRSGLAAGHYWQLVTHIFLHGGVWHLLMNMLTLFFVGRQVEDLVGTRHYLGIFFGGGIVGGLAHVAWDGFGTVVGASGAITAALIAFTTMLPEFELMLLLFFVLPVRLKAKYLGLGVVGISVLMLLANNSTVSHAAHLGGALLGWIYVKQLGYGNPLPLQAYLWERKRRAQRRESLTPGQYISEEIDPILDKISREGLHSLTRAERKILERGREKIASRTRSV